METHDFIVIGAGMAGASVAAELSRTASVLVLEAEGRPGYHSTGRSAAMYSPGYGPAPVRALTRASGGFLAAPPQGFTTGPILSPRATLMIARADQAASFDAAWRDLSGDAAVSLLDADQVQDTVPLLRPGYAARGILDETGSDIDVDRLHQGYLRQAKGQGAQVLCDALVGALSHDGKIWSVTTRQGVFHARAVVNAAGAWADQVGQLACAERIGLVPKRRTALIVAAPSGVACADVPLTVDIDEDFYLKPDAGRLLISPANEDPSAPTDAQPDEMDIALCIDRIERAFDLSVRRIETRWAGLRSFVADKAPVIGWSEKAPAFLWLAGQGGYGIQMAPAAARLAAALGLGGVMPSDIAAQGLSLQAVAPGRFGG